MRIFLPVVYEQLKQLVLAKAGVAVITPSDCQIISGKIFNFTKKQISDTTLKRIFGFALTKSIPSLYTLNTLATYCGFMSWEDFCDYQTSGSSSADVELEEQVDTMELIIRKTTHTTLQALKNKSVIPFSLTIPRSFLTEHLEQFLNEGNRVTVLAAPVGYGKTMALCHWMEEKLTEKLIGRNNDQFLLLSGKILAGLSPGVSAVNWLLALMGMPSGMGMHAIKNVTELSYDRFFLIIDEFDLTAFKPEQFDLLFSMLLDLLAITEDVPNFKVILTMRSYSWTHLYKRLQMDDRLKDWFLGISYNNYDHQNFPLFNLSEIRELALKVNPETKIPEVFHPEMQAFFRHPLFFQYYYQLNHNDLQLNGLDHFRIYEVINRFCYDKIYVGKYSTEKVLLLRAVNNAGHFINGEFMADKIAIYDQLRLYKEAYHDLLSIGYLKEVNLGTESRYSEYVMFPNKRMFASNIAKKLIYDSANDSNQLCNILNERIPVNCRVHILKWCIFNFVKENNYDFFAHLHKVDLSAPDKATLLTFVTSLIKRNFLQTNNFTEDEDIFNSERQESFYYFFGFEFVSSDYLGALKDLLQLKLNDNIKIWINTCIGIIGIIDLNKELIQTSIDNLRAFDEDLFYDFEINPLWCIETIYQFFTKGTVNKRALQQITRFLFKDISDIKTVCNPGSNNVLYLLALSTLQISGNKHKVLRMLKKLKLLKQLNDLSGSSYEFFLDITLSATLYDLGRIQDGLDVYKKLVDNYMSNKQLYTPYMISCLDFLSVVSVNFTESNKKAYGIIENIVYQHDKSSTKLLDILSIANFLDVNKTCSASDLYKAASIKYKKLLMCTGFDPPYFLQ